MIEKTDNTETVIDLREVFGTLLHRWWVIFLCALLCGMGTFGYTYLAIEPTYEASTLMYVNNSSISIGSTSVSISNSELTVAQKLVATYVVILQSRTMLNRVIDEAELDYTYQELRDMVKAEAVNETEVFRVVVTSHSPVEAEKIANTIADILPDTIANIVAGSDVRIVDYAVVPERRAAPNYTRNAAIGALIGIVLSAIAVIVAHMLDENIRSEDYLTQTYPDIPLLAVIPDMKPSTKHRSSEPQSPSPARRSMSRPPASRSAAPSGRTAAARPGVSSGASRRPQNAKRASAAPMPAPGGEERALGNRQSGQERKNVPQTAQNAVRKGQPSKKAAPVSKSDRLAGRSEQKKAAEMRTGDRKAAQPAAPAEARAAAQEKTREGDKSGAQAKTQTEGQANQADGRGDKKGQLIWDKKVRKWKEID